MARVVLDASAVLAMLQNEPGSERVEAVIEDALLCAANLSEVLSKLMDKGASASEATLIVGSLPCRTSAFDFEMALHCGQLRGSTRTAGLSLGDRACLALAAREGLPVLTTDRAWASVKVGVDIDVIR